MGPARWKDPPEDIKRRKIFVGGLPRGVNEETIYNYFTKFGEIEDYILMRHQETGAPKGFGFIIFKDI